MHTPPQQQGTQTYLGSVILQPLPKRSQVAQTVVSWLIIGLASLFILAIVLILFIGNQAVTVLGVLAACLPLVFVTLVVWFIDRWEPEPRLLMVGAVLWGGGFATGLTLLTGAIGDLMFPALANDVFGAVVRAPVLEELYKGLGLLVIFAIARRSFNGPTDGIVYGALIGAGFAFTENILYFVSQTVEVGAGGFIFQFIVRGIAMPLLHPMCVTFTGIGLGLGARRGGWGSALGGWALGLIPAIFLHFLWNGGSMLVGALAGDDGLAQLGAMLGYFTFVMLPIFIGWIIMVFRFRAGDKKLLRSRLDEYAAVGWFSPAEVNMLTSMQGRSGARRWAKQHGPIAARAMKEFIGESTRLAHARHQLLIDPAREHKAADERNILTYLTQVRATLNGAIGAARQHAGPGWAGPRY